MSLFPPIFYIYCAIALFSYEPGSAFLQTLISRHPQLATTLQNSGHPRASRQVTPRVTPSYTPIQTPRPEAKLAMRPLQTPLIRPQVANQQSPTYLQFGSPQFRTPSR